MKSKLYFITGASSGFGQALAQNLIEAGHTVISLSRSQTKSIISKNFYQIKVDFSKNFQKSLSQKISKCIKKINLKDFTEIILINNAAIVLPIEQIGFFQEKDLQKHMQVNLVAPMIMTQLFLNVTKKIKTYRLVVQITSGAAVNPVEGWAAYCSGKAGLNMFNQVLSTQMNQDKNFKAIGYSPGIMDTNMQKDIRSSKSSSFPNLSEFKKYKSEGKLRSVDYVASDLLKVISDFSEIEPGTIYRVS